MTNKEKFMEVMNQTFNAGLTKENFTESSPCSPYEVYKKKACMSYTCEGCAKWWDEEYDGKLVKHCRPIYKNRPKWHSRYYRIGETLNEKPLYQKEMVFLEKNIIAYCSSCGKRLCSRFTNFCPNCGAKVDGNNYEEE